MKKLFYSSLFVAFSSTSFAFDCKKVFLPVDFVICSSQSVMTANADHEQAWLSARGRLTLGQKKTLLDDQRNWLKTFPIRCGIPAKGKLTEVITMTMQECVSNELKDRAAYLQNYSTPTFADAGGTTAKPFGLNGQIEGTKPVERHLNELSNSDYQKEFEISRTGKALAYDDAINEIKKSEIINQADHDMIKIINLMSEKIQEWTGEIETIRVYEGLVSVTISSGGRVLYHSNKDITSGSEVYRQLSNLRIRQPVRFSGTLAKRVFKKFSSTDNGYEGNFFENASLTNPVFYVNFVSIQPLQ